VIGGGIVFDLTTLAGVLGSVTSDDMNGIWSDSDEMVMTLAPCGLAAEAFFASVVLGRKGVGLVGEIASYCAGLEALQPVGRWETFCLFGALSSATSSSCSFSFRDWYGDFMGIALPVGPFGVPRSVFNDL
jgi:hypothetical protein